MPYAIKRAATGGVEQLEYTEVNSADLGPEEVRIKHHAIGVNFIDIYHREGSYPLSNDQGILGVEAAGEIVEAGNAVGELRVGDKVAYTTAKGGAYATENVMPANRVVKLPSQVDVKEAAALMVQGMTAQYLLRRCTKVTKRDRILVHAAAGGVGLLLCQWARSIGAEIWGTVSSEKKAEQAIEAGCDHTINYTKEDFVDRILADTDGIGARIIYDGVGKDTFIHGLDALRTRGTCVLYGQASGPVEPFDPSILAQKGSLYLTRPSLFDYTKTRRDLLASANEMFKALISEKIRANIHHEIPLKDAAKAHDMLENRETTGSIILIP
jgi:NADPH2:quinone reductase